MPKPQSDFAPPTPEDDEKALQTFLQEIRILVPGAQVVGGVLFSVPFQARFEKLTAGQRTTFLLTFVATVLAVILFLAPAVYHRIASPIHRKREFVALGTRILLMGFVPLAVSTALSSYLVVSMVVGEGAGAAVAAVLSALLLMMWGGMPLLRLHDRTRPPPS